jgi:hypothetical protein
VQGRFCGSPPSSKPLCMRSSSVARLFPACKGILCGIPYRSIRIIVGVVCRGGGDERVFTADGRNHWGWEQWGERHPGGEGKGKGKETKGGCCHRVQLWLF